ncbi:MAG: MFS transporter [Desulfitobacteriaceae bacterium]|nr:MFS transporter [Desulfitobacteriaceae bacterium]MDD4752530.1 MFS transporter [Desulfitobacteriaceae bacterium]
MPLWKRNLTGLTFSLFLTFAAWNSIMPFLPLYLEQELGVHGDSAIKFWTGAIFGINFLTMMIVAPFWGKVGDKYGRKLMIIRSGVGLGFVIMLMGLAQTPLQLLLLRLLNGTISGMNPASIALVSTNSPKEKVGFALGTLQSGTVAGSILGPVIGGFLAEFLGFRQIFYFTGCVLLFSTLLVQIFVKEINKPDSAVQTSRMKSDMKRIFCTTPLLTLFTTGFLIQFALLSTNTFVPIFAQELLPQDRESLSLLIGIAVSATGVASMFFSPVLGKLGDRVGSQRVLFYNLIGTTVFLIPHIFVGSYLQFLVCRFLLGLCIGGLIPSVNALIRKFAPEGMESSTYGYSNSFIYLGMMMGPIIGGILSGIIGVRGLFILAAFLFLVNTFWFHKHISQINRDCRNYAL